MSADIIEKRDSFRRMADSTAAHLCQLLEDAQDPAVELVHRAEQLFDAIEDHDHADPDLARIKLNLSVREAERLATSLILAASLVGAAIATSQLNTR